MMEDGPSTSSFESTSLVIEETEEAGQDVVEEVKTADSSMLPVITEQVNMPDGEFVQLAHDGDEEKMPVEFKSEPTEISEIGGLDHFVTVTEVDSEPTVETSELNENTEMGTVMKTEVISSESADSSVPESIQQAVPQQFIILTRTAEGGAEPVEIQGMPSKYIRFEGADGQTYVFAVADDSSENSDSVKALPTQQIVPAKNVKVSRKRPASVSSPVTAAPATSPTSSRVKSTHNANTDGINQAWFTTRDDKNALHKEGHQWKQGQWTKEEVDVLETNINNYCKEHNIKDPAEVIFEMSKDERKDFYRTIALGIHRPLFSVYRRVTRMYDRKNHRGKYSTNEMKHLRVLRAKHGNDWAAIGVALGRSASSVKDKCRLMKDNCKSGKWYPEEEARLADAVYKLTGVKPSESITSGLSWASVAEHVGTRSEKQCRTKWLNYLNWKQQGGADWTRDDDQLLIEKVSNMNVNNDSEIDWVALSQDWKSVRSPQWLRGKWWALKRHIADYNKLSYPALLEQMKQVIYWNLKPKAGTRTIKGESQSEFFKNCFPVSITSGVDGSSSLALSYCPSEEEGGFQAFEVLQQWTPQVIGAVAQAGNAADGTAQGILSGEGHIIVHTLAPGLGENIQLNGQQQVIISSAGIHGEGEEGVEGQEMTIQVAADGLVQTDQGLHTLSSSEHLDSEIPNTFESGSEEIVAVSEFHGQPVTGEQDIMSHDVFETVTSEAGGDLGMGVASPTHTSSLMTSLKDPILMSSSDVECEKSQSAELTDEASGLMD
ncbi:cyclin-D-binding Myb-like transcription factor 1 [Aplysia californica]|uniref:Cyclin-D-binding Myb-like transcription factor 1 n=1 Tax=Aplysia californica TaxID=6500 RepID=A0ABM0JBL2_APLCA|nr:cyclin-D-binding Myb-like transcription factor 1 [Aplysia californica]XP_005089920.1 cyclin-D-binding Myb-like transcription factor 1 [Aplysia californica]XP_005089921.1 cyclin-D-binding Myb-like transcription factor 1 [Aplysia californica]